MTAADIRWIQRLHNYGTALQHLTAAVALARERPLSDLEQQGVVQAFEFTHELAWNVLKDYLEEQGFVGLIGSKDASREAFKNGLLEDGEVWMDMIRARNQSSHTYSDKVRRALGQDILARFHPAFLAMQARFQAFLNKETGPA